MPQRTSYREGAPNWVDLASPDLAGAKRFYGGLLGWTFEDAGGYTLCLRDGLTVAGIGPQTDGAAPSEWSTYLASDDVERTADRIARAGGRVLLEPLDVFDAGRLLYAADPTGAGFGVWQGKAHPGSGLVDEPGAPTWSELHTRDGARADAFYRAVFGHAHDQLGDGRSFDYSLVKVGDEVVGGRLQLGDDVPAGIRAHWLTYFAVSDTDATVAAVTAHGGTVQRAAVDSPYGRLAIVADPWGAGFAVIQLPPS